MDILDQAIKSLKTLRSRLRTNRSLARAWYFAGIVAVVFSTVSVPWLWNPYVHVKASQLRLQFSCLPSIMHLKLVDQHARIATAELHTESGMPGAMISGIFPLQSNQIGDDVSIVVAQADERLILGRIGPGQSLTSRVVLTFARSMSIDLRKVEIEKPEEAAYFNCEAQAISGKALAAMFGDSVGSVQRIRPIQQQISNLVLDHNEALGNFFVGTMTVTILWLAGVFLLAARQRYFLSDLDLRNRTRQRMREVASELSTKGPAAVIQADFVTIYRRLNFVRNLGPICGFALTVSSLIAALHPAVQADKDSFRFLSSLQIALVSTLAGLGIRILADFAIRAHRSIALLNVALEETRGGSHDSQR